MKKIILTLLFFSALLLSSCTEEIKQKNFTEEEALDRFYNSRTYTFFADPAQGLQAMSDRYIVDEILQE